MMLPERKVVYIPLILPDNLLQGFAFLALLLGVVVASVGMARSDWLVTEITTTDQDTLIQEQIGIRAGLQVMVVRYCKTMLSGDGEPWCLKDTISYDSCDVDNPWCTQRPTTAVPFAFFIIAACIAGLGVPAGLIRSPFLPAAGLAAACLSFAGMLVYKHANAPRYAAALRSIMEAADSEAGPESFSYFGAGYFLVLVATVFFGFACIMGAVGLRQAHAAARLRREQEQAAAAQAAAQTAS
jgi:hypothetical protein